MTRDKKKKVIFGILVLAWMSLIFFMSAQPSDKSSEMSIIVGEQIGKIVQPEFEEWTPQEQYEYALSIELIVRKLAHASEYAILAILSMNAVGHKVRYALPICVAYAASDEIHQLFVPGRSGNIKDVMIDSSGVIAGILLTLIVGFLLKKIMGDKYANLHDGTGCRNDE